MKETYGHGRSQSSVPLLPYADNTPPATPFASAFRIKGSATTRRKTAFVLCAFASVASLGVLASWAIISGQSGSYLAPQPAADEAYLRDALGQTNWTASAPLPVLHDDDVAPLESEYSPYVLGAPTLSFRDNLRNDTKYITSWLSAGWSASNKLFIPSCANL